MKSRFSPVVAGEYFSIIRHRKTVVRVLQKLRIFKHTHGFSVREDQWPTFSEQFTIKKKVPWENLIWKSESLFLVHVSSIISKLVTLEYRKIWIFGKSNNFLFPTMYYIVSVFREVKRLKLLPKLNSAMKNVSFELQFFDKCLLFLNNLSYF